MLVGMNIPTKSIALCIGYVRAVDIRRKGSIPYAFYLPYNLLIGIK